MVGVVYNHDEALLARFGAYFTHEASQSGDQTKTIKLMVDLELEDNTGKQLQPGTFMFWLKNREGQVATALYSGFSDPDSTALTEEEALKSPYLPVIYEIGDFIVACEPKIRQYLGCRAPKK
jgi:hypothetical protein